MGLAAGQTTAAAASLGAHPGAVGAGPEWHPATTGDTGHDPNGRMGQAAGEACQKAVAGPVRYGRFGPHDVAGRERLAQYMLRCPFSLQRMIKVTPEGKVVYVAEKRDCRRFPRPASRDQFNAVSRDFQVFDPMDFIAGEHANRVTPLPQSVTGRQPPKPVVVAPLRRGVA